MWKLQVSYLSMKAINPPVNAEQSSTELRVVYNRRRLGEAGLPSTQSHPDWMQSVTKGQNIVFKMCDYKR